MQSTRPAPEAAATPNPYRPLPDAAFYDEAGAALGVSADALRKAVTAGVLSEFRVNGRPALVWTIDELKAKGVIEPPADKPPVASPPAPSAHFPDQLVSPKWVCELLGVARRTVFHYVDKRILPEPIRINARVLRWRRRDIEAAIAARRIGYTTEEAGAGSQEPQQPHEPTPAPPPEPVVAIQPAGVSPEPTRMPAGDDAALDALLGEAKAIAEGARASRPDRRACEPRPGGGHEPLPLVEASQAASSARL